MGQATRDNPKAQRLGSGSNQFFHTDIELDITFQSLVLKPSEESPKIIDPILFQLRHSLNHGLIVLDLESTGKNFASIAEKLGELLIEWGHTGVEKATKLKAGSFLCVFKKTQGRLKKTPGPFWAKNSTYRRLIQILQKNSRHFIPKIMFFMGVTPFRSFLLTNF